MELTDEEIMDRMSIPEDKRQNPIYRGLARGLRSVYEELDSIQRSIKELGGIQKDHDSSIGGLKEDSKTYKNNAKETKKVLTQYGKLFDKTDRGIKTVEDTMKESVEALKEEIETQGKNLEEINNCIMELVEEEEE